MSNTPNKEAFEQAFAIISAPLTSENTSLKEQLEEAKAENDRLQAENKTLKAKLNLSDPNHTSAIVQSLVNKFNVSIYSLPH